MIEVISVSQRYGSTLALDDVSFTVRKGSITALIGPNGAGKTTLIRRAVGTLAGDGRVLFDGLRYEDLSRPLATVGVVLGDDLLVRGMRLGDYVRAVGAASGASRARCASCLAQVGLERQAGFLVGRLSAGMRQRAAMAAAMAGDPMMFLLDEPWTGLDVMQAEALSRWLSQFVAGGGTALVSSHSLNRLEGLADQLVIMADGRVRAIGPASQIRGRGGASTIVEVATSQALIAQSLLAESDAVVSQITPGRLRVDGLPPETVGRILWSADVLVRELTTDRKSLEEAVLEVLGE
jgi:ABC-2 type transport system ATP-binding protein